MTPQQWSEVVGMYQTLRALCDDVEDGMWEQAKEAAAEYRASDRGDNAKLDFANDLNDILAEFGYPKIVIDEPATDTTIAPGTPCQRCVTVFGPDNALPATVTIPSVLMPGASITLCREHAVGDYP